jgi:hypothetical protein
MLVRAMLGPEEGEDCELEMVRLAAEERSDADELPVSESECAVERLFRDAAQRTTQRRSLAASPDVASSR